ncbi:unnamed protein product [Peronospora belbahrii]|uniref:Calmodulin-binding domain-containing protein n=1 Tax=Peronospora belbahrii TaxID=622444 RepID=A0ABN8DB95_9STRA|nr:unnamed protein product [Peronospora belbahrii]
MARPGGGLRKENAAAAAATDKPSFAPGKGKFKLRTSTSPLPLVTKKQLNWEKQSTAKFHAVAGAGKTSTEKPSNTKPSIFATNSFIRPSKKDEVPKKSSGFSFMKFQSKSRDLGQLSDKSSAKATPLTLASTRPLLSKISTKEPATKTKCTTNEANNAPVFKLPTKKGSLFSFRAGTMSSSTKKRKTAESLAHKDEKAVVFCNNGLAKSISLDNLAINKDKKRHSGARGEKAGPKDGIRSTVPYSIKIGEMGMKKDDGAVLKKRGLLVDSVIAGRALKQIKRVPAAALHPPQHTGMIKSGSLLGRPFQSNQDPNVSIQRKCMLNPKETPIGSAADPVNNVLSSAEAPLSPGECEIEEELAVKLLCTADDDKEEKFLVRAAAIQEFADRVGLEQKQIRNRLLDAHADISESLLDALTDLMAEEGGIGIDKLDFNMNVDVNVDDAFLQDDAIQIFQ